MELAKSQSRVARLSTEKVRKIWTEAFGSGEPGKSLYYREYLIFAILLNVALIFAVLGLSYFKRLPPEVPLFYGIAEGEAQLVSNWQLLIPSGVSLGFLFLNSTLAYLFKDEFLKKTLIIATFSLTLLSVVTTIKIITLVGNI